MKYAAHSVGRSGARLLEPPQCWNGFAVNHFPAEVRKILTKALRVSVEFGRLRRKSVADTVCGGKRLPHSRANLLQAEITFRFEIQKHELVIESAHQDVFRQFDAIEKRNIHFNPSLQATR